MTNTETIVKVKAPRVRKALPERSPKPVDGMLLHSVVITHRLSGPGYFTCVTATFTDPKSRPGYKVKDEVCVWSETTYTPFPSRPSLAALLRASSRAVWGMSTSQTAAELDGQDPIPGL